MTNMLIEAVFMSFVVGGIVGAMIALSLKSSKSWGQQHDANNTDEFQPLRIRADRQRYRR
ncbi:MAG: hypothetical protein IT488_14125 [Gammaproteobacteria bacterium]|nr:hypothetical protein [Gammaproteobacteria bacterium]